MSSQDQPKTRFAPKEPVQLDAPKDRGFTRAELARYNGVTEPELYIAIKGVVYDVTRNKSMYGSGQNYSVFVGKDASLLLATSTLDGSEGSNYESKSKPERDQILTQLSDVHKNTLEQWVSFFSQRYNVMGTLVD